MSIEAPVARSTGSAGRQLDHDDHRLAARVFTACCAAFCTTRSADRTDGAGDGATSCSTETSTPFWLTLTTRQPALPSVHRRRRCDIVEDRRREVLVGREPSACGVITTPGGCPIAAATRLLSSACSESNGTGRQAGCSASGCGSLSVSSKGAARPPPRVPCREELAAGLASSE